MAKAYAVTPAVRMINWLMSGMIRLGIAPDGMYLLTVKGRKSGRPYTLPVTLVEQGGYRWLVSPYGEVNWVRNARAAGEVTLRRGRVEERRAIVEADAQQSAPVLKQYLIEGPVVRPYFDVTPASPLEAFTAEAPRHPVFQLCMMDK